MLDKHSLVTIIDADSICWIVAYNNRDVEDTDKVLAATDSFVTNILASTSCTHYIAFIGGTKCFRYELATHKPYKANRPESPDWFKKWGTVIKAHLRDVWSFQVVNGIEADDAVSIAVEELRFIDINYIIAHADKDLRQLSGNHYNIRTHKREYISELDGAKNLYKQILLGDTSDNIEGLKGVGPKRASQFIDGLTTEYDMASMCRLLFDNKYHDRGKMYEEMYSLCKLLNRSYPYTELALDYIEVERKEDTTLDTFITEFFS